MSVFAWSKYTSEVTYEWDEPYSIYIENIPDAIIEFPVYENYKWDRINKEFSVYGDVYDANHMFVEPIVVYRLEDNNLIRYEYTYRHGGLSTNVYVSVANSTIETNIIHYVRGIYIERITDTDSSLFPTDGRHSTDGYWYVFLGEVDVAELSIKINNSWINSKAIYVKAGDSWREAKELYVKVNGEWKLSK